MINTQRTVVRNLATGAESIYVGISAQRAVVCAWEQDRGNWSTWTYGQSLAPVQETRQSLIAGDWCALKPVTK